MTNQPSGSLLAAVTAPTPEERVADAMRVLVSASPHLSRHEKQALHDFARGRNSVTFYRVISACERCPDIAAALAFPEAIRGATLARHPDFSMLPSDAILSSQVSDSAEDLAVRQYLISPTAATRQRAIAALLQQAESSRIAADILYRVSTGPQLQVVR